MIKFVLMGFELVTTVFLSKNNIIQVIHSNQQPSREIDTLVNISYLSFRKNLDLVVYVQIRCEINPSLI